MTLHAIAELRRIELRAILVSPAGQHTRYLLAAYLRHVFIVVSSLLAIALTIDLWPQLQDVAQGRDAGPLYAVWRVVRFSALRTPDLIAPLMPFSTFLGVVWTEIVLTQSGERMLIWNTGRSPIQCLAPALALGVLLGAAGFLLDAYLGPGSMHVQMQERLGLDGKRLDRARVDRMHWIATEGGLLHTQIAFGPPPELHNLMIYRLGANGALHEVDEAATAHLGTDGSWLMRNGRSWTAPQESLGGTGARATFTIGSTERERMIPFSARKVVLKIDPLWLTYFGVETQYIPLSVLQQLARTDKGILSTGRYRTRVQMLYGGLLLPLGMALLAASLSMFYFAYQVPPPAVVGVLFCGYLGHFAIKACLLMGQNGYMIPVLAGWLVPLALLAGTLAVLRRSELQRQGLL